MSPVLLSTTAKKNIEAIAQVEQQLHGRRSRVEKFGDGIAAFFGSLWFIGAHAAFLVIWIVVNTGLLPGLLPGLTVFDSYPFPFLGLIIGIEFIFLTTFVLMNQNLQSRRQEKWGHLTLQVCLLAEQEVTKNMQMLHQICQHLKLNNPGTDEELQDLTQTTHVTSLVEEIEKAREVGEELIEHLDHLQEGINQSHAGMG